MDSICLKPAFQGMMPPVSASISRADSRAPTEKPVVTPAARRFSFRLKPLEFLRLSSGNDVVIKGKTEDSLDRDARKKILGVDEGENVNTAAAEGQKENWVLKILQVASAWRRKDEEPEEEQIGVSGSHDPLNDEKKEHCDACKSSENDENEELEFDRESFSTLLKRVTLTDVKLFAKLSYLGNLAYSIPKIKPEHLLKYHGLRFVTSSIEKRESAKKAEKLQGSIEDEAETTQKDVTEEEEHKNPILRISPSVAYRIAASAASYLYSQSKSILPFKPSKNSDMPKGENKESAHTHMLKHSDMASLMATTDSVTAVVAAKEEVKQAVADDLNSTRSSPCQWFVCDDDETATRYFVIQGSESFASWQANLLFEPVVFEGMDVLVHRGIYEIAKGMYEQMLPEIHAHLDSHGRNRAMFRFTGHSLGGSLSLLVNLMLLIRDQVPASCLLPVVTFGSPSIMCGGDTLFHTLGLPKSHLQAITMHRDIVPRAFSCSYPNRVVEILRAVNRSFREHPCLNKQKLLYSPMGKVLILQPEEKMSPHHHLLPSGSGLYILTSSFSETKEAERQLRTATTVFLNSPHPLEILSDRSSYGSEGTIKRDHDMSSYLKSLKCVIRKELRQIRRVKRERRRILWWPLDAARGNNLEIVRSSLDDTEKLLFSNILQTGKDSLIRIGRFVASRNLHLVVLLFFPVKMLLVGAYGLIRFH